MRIFFSGQQPNNQWELSKLRSRRKAANQRRAAKSQFNQIDKFWKCGRGNHKLPGLRGEAGHGQVEGGQKNPPSDVTIVPCSDVTVDRGRQQLSAESRGEAESGQVAQSGLHREDGRGKISQSERSNFKSENFRFLRELDWKTKRWKQIDGNVGENKIHWKSSRQF